MQRLTTDQLQLKVKKLIKPYLGGARKPTLNECRAKVEDLIRKQLSGDIEQVDIDLKNDLEEIASLRELSRLLSI